MHNSRPPLGMTSERRHRAADQASAIAAATRQRQPVMAEQSWILRAISWLGSAILEGFALYGQSLYPCVLELAEDPRAQAETTQPRAVPPLPARENPWLPPGGWSHDIDIRACPVSASSQSPQRTRRWFRLAAVLPRRRTGGSKRSSRERLDVPDDRCMRDDGADPHDTIPVPPRFDLVR